MVKKHLFLLLLLVPALLYAEDAEVQWYLISPSEIESLEIYNRNLEMTNKQLSQQVKTLQAQSTNLKEQLTTQAKTITALEKSYNELEVEKSTIIANLHNENKELIAKNAKNKNRFFAFLSISLIELSIIILLCFLFFKKRK